MNVQSGSQEKLKQYSTTQAPGLPCSLGACPRASSSGSEPVRLPRLPSTQHKACSRISKSGEMTVPRSPCPMQTQGHLFPVQSCGQFCPQNPQVCSRPPALAMSPLSARSAAAQHSPLHSSEGQTCGQEGGRGAYRRQRGLSGTL